jgi:hypothetical protein
VSEGLEKVSSECILERAIGRITLINEAARSSDLLGILVKVFLQGGSAFFLRDAVM